MKGKVSPRRFGENKLVFMHTLIFQLEKEEPRTLTYEMLINQKEGWKTSSKSAASIQSAVYEPRKITTLKKSYCA